LRMALIHVLRNVFLGSGISSWSDGRAVKRTARQDGV
jgi:hypothetical protein